MKAQENRPSTEENAAPGRLDGRKLRSERSREAIVDAMFQLIEEGKLRPTSARIAERAGVSVRSVFQHFTDLEDLFIAVADRQALRVGPLYARIEYKGSVEERLSVWATRRTTLYESVAPIRRAALVQELRSPSVAERLGFARRLNRKDLSWAFREELGPVAVDEAGIDPRWDALVAVSTFRFWDCLRVTAGLDVEAATRALKAAMRGVLSSR